MEAIGAAASIVQIVQLGLGLAKSLDKFVANAKRIDKDLQAIASDVQHLSTTLHSANAEIRAGVEMDLYSSEGVRRFREVLNGVWHAFHQVQSLLDNLTRASDGSDGSRSSASIALRVRLRWAFEKKDVMMLLRSELERQKNNLALMLGTFNIALAQRSLAKICDQSVSFDAQEQRIRELYAQNEASQKRYNDLVKSRKSSVSFGGLNKAALKGKIGIVPCEPVASSSRSGEQERATDHTGLDPISISLESCTAAVLVLLNYVQQTIEEWSCDRTFEPFTFSTATATLLGDISKSVGEVPNVQLPGRCSSRPRTRSSLPSVSAQELQPRASSAHRRSHGDDVVPVEEENANFSTELPRKRASRRRIRDIARSLIGCDELLQLPVDARTNDCAPRPGWHENLCQHPPMSFDYFPNGELRPSAIDPGQAAAEAEERIAQSRRRRAGSASSSSDEDWEPTILSLANHGSDEEGKEETQVQISGPEVENTPNPRFSFPKVGTAIRACQSMEARRPRPDHRLGQSTVPLFSFVPEGKEVDSKSHTLAPRAARRTGRQNSRVTLSGQDWSKVMAEADGKPWSSSSLPATPLGFRPGSEGQSHQSQDAQPDIVDQLLRQWTTVRT